MLALGGVLVFGMAMVAGAEPAPAGAEGGHDKAVSAEHEWGFGGLDLTAQQKDQLRTDRISREKKLIQLQADKKLLHLDLRAAEEQETPDMGKIESIAGKIGDLQAKVIVEQAKGRQFFLSVLTPEQKKKLEKNFGEHRGMMRHHGENCEKCEDQRGEE